MSIIWASCPRSSCIASSLHQESKVVSLAHAAATGAPSRSAQRFTGETGLSGPTAFSSLAEGFDARVCALWRSRFHGRMTRDSSTSPLSSTTRQRYRDGSEALGLKLFLRLQEGAVHTRSCLGSIERMSSTE